MTARRVTALILAALACVVAGLLTAVPAYAAAPAVTSFTPRTGPMGTLVTITGTGFAAPATVKFNGVAATSPTVVSATKITAAVPATATTGTVSVTTSGGTGTSTASYTVTAGAALATTSGPPTTTTALSLSGFGASEAVDLYVDSTEVSLAVTNGSGQLSTNVKIPASATPGDHYVTAVGRKSGSAAQVAFTVRTDWARLGFDNTDTGNNPYENVLSPSTVGKIRELWRFNPGTPAQDTPIVNDGVVYATYYGGIVKAVDAATGVQKWTKTVGGSFMYSPMTYASGSVYVGTTDGNVLSLSAATGAVRWSFATGDGIYSGARVVGNVVYIGSYDSKVYALNRVTGALIWSYTTGNAVFATPMVYGKNVYVGSLDGTLYALDAATGALTWSYTTGSAVVASAVAADGLVYVASEDKTVTALSPSTGTVRWSYTAPSAVDATPSLDGGVLFVGDIGGDVIALDAGDGSVRWARNLSATEVFPGPLATANGVVYATTPRHTYILAESNGARLRTLADGDNPAGPIVADGTVIVPSDTTDAQGLVAYALPASAQPRTTRPDPSSLKPTL